MTFLVRFGKQYTCNYVHIKGNKLNLLSSYNSIWHNDKVPILVYLNSHKIVKLHAVTSYKCQVTCSSCHNTSLKKHTAFTV